MDRRQLAAMCVLFGLGCGSSSASTEGASETASTGAEATAPAGPRVTGEWVLAGAPFVPDVALAYTNADGTYEVRLASPAIDCEYARNGGVPPDGLRMIHVHSLAWTPGGSMTSSGGALEGQVAFDDGMSQFLGNGTVTFGAVPSADGVGTLTIAAGDGETPARHNANGEVDVTLCP